MVSFASSPSTTYVGETSVFGVSKPQNSEAMVGRAVDIIRLQAPPRAPRETVERLSLFLSLPGSKAWAKRTKAPDFPTKTENRGLFCAFMGSVI